MNPLHIHNWQPLIIMYQRADGSTYTPYGSIGSMIGFSCTCGARDIRWPAMAAKSGLTEEQAVAAVAGVTA